MPGPDVLHLTLELLFTSLAPGAALSLQGGDKPHQVCLVQINPALSRAA